MRVAVVLPYLPDLSGSIDTLEISGAAVALQVILRRYANDPNVETLELYLAPRDLLNGESLSRLAGQLLWPENFGRGKLEIYSIYSLPEVWADGRERVVHTNGLHLLARDRDLRDRYATGPTVVGGDMHCVDHLSVVNSLRQYVQTPRTEFDRIYAPSTAIERSLHATFNVLGTPKHTDVHLLARLIDDTGLWPLAQSERRADVRRSLGLPEEGDLALCVGRMSPATKTDFAVLTEVFAESSKPGQHLVIAGNEEYVGYADFVRTVARDLGVGERVHVLGGFKAEVKGDLYRSADFLVFPSDSGNEIFGLAAVEAMACGLPVLGTDWDGLRDTIEHEITGLKVPTYVGPPLGRFDGMSSAADEKTSHLMRAQTTVIDRRAFGEAFARLFGDSELRERMARAAFAAFKTRLNPDELYVKLLAGYRDQLEIAKREPSDEATKRRRWAESHSLAVPSFEQFEGYGTRPLLNPEHRFVTTSKGRSVLSGAKPVGLIPDVATVLPAEVIELILARLESPASSQAFEEFAEASQLPSDLIRFGLASLCKQGYVSVEHGLHAG
jgi:glycosyltransferase involved in cell wall biosynthesis